MADKRSCFQWIFRLDCGDGETCKVISFAHSGTTMVTPWHNVKLTPDTDGFVHCSVYIDVKTGIAATAANGELLDYGEMQDAKASPLVCIGDGGSGCGGKAALKHFVIERI